jgi:hypothetical protein
MAPFPKSERVKTVVHFRANPRSGFERKQIDKKKKNA